MSSCLFCAIAAGEIPAKVVAENDHFMAFADIAPVAPVHILAIPKTHYATAAEYVSNDLEDFSNLMLFLTEIGESECPNGYRIVFNTSVDGGQTVPHVHGHVIGGRQLQWPPG
jgi:histidine triad (HIT) family protein